MDTFLLIFLLTILTGGLGVLFSMGTLDIIRNHFPYILFEQHAKRVLRGRYRVERHDDYFKIKKFFVNARVKIFEWDENNARFEISTGYENLFSLKYDLKQQKIHDFDCVPAFAKGVNNDNFIAFLESYLPMIIANESGKKSERVLAIEKVKNLANSFQPQLLKKEETTLRIEIPKQPSAEMQQLIEKINEVAKALQEKKETLPFEIQHQLESLLGKRLPTLLKYTNQHEKEVMQALQDVLHKLREWQTVSENISDNEFEREFILIQNITKS